MGGHKGQLNWGEEPGAQSNLSINTYNSQGKPLRGTGVTAAGADSAAPSELAVSSQVPNSIRISP